MESRRALSGANFLKNFSRIPVSALPAVAKLATRLLRLRRTEIDLSESGVAASLSEIAKFWRE